MLKRLKNRSQGFTIIEVLIVLAIAGLIMLIVFLAVPALQRNSRNTQRNSDASLVAAAVNECLANRNGQTASCDALNEISIDTARLGQLQTVTPGAGTGSITEARWAFSTRCLPDGSGTTGGTSRQFAVTFQIENSAGTGVNRCLDS